MWGNVLSYQYVEEESNSQLGILRWWEYLVKPGIKKIGLERTNEMYAEKKEVLNLLFIRQAYLTRKLQLGQIHRLGS